MAFNWIWVIAGYVWITTVTHSDGTSCRSPEDCLYQDLFTGYNIYTRPRAQPSETVEVTVVLTPNSLAAIDEKNQVMNLVAVIHAFWVDSYLQWDPDQYNGTELLNVPTDQVWHPKIAILNSADKFIQKSHKEDFYALIKSNGLVSWSFGGTFSTTCSLDISSYPYDSQNCSLQVFNWGFDSSYVSLNSVGEVDLLSYTNNSLWDMVDTSITTTEYSGNNNIYIGIQFTLNWQRKTLYYQFNMVLPIVLLLLVSMGIFWLPPESGERISLAITVLLSYTVFLIVIMDNTPINSERLPLISQFVIIVMISTTITLLQSLVVVRLSIRANRPPRWLRTLAFDYLACLFCLKKDVPSVDDDRDFQHVNKNKPQEQITDLEDTVSSTKDKVTQQHTQQEILRVMTELLNIQQNQILTDSYCSEWKLIGNILDHLAFVMIATGTIIAIIVVFAS